jgi:hypothetical protein
MKCKDCGEEVEVIRGSSGREVQVDTPGRKVWARDHTMIAIARESIFRPVIGFDEHHCDPEKFRKKFYEEIPEENKTEVTTVEEDPKPEPPKPRKEGSKKKKKKKKS